MRVGPERLYRRMADAFVRLGFAVFRFDFYGLGDSEGELKETWVKDVYNHIEVGRFVEDAIDAMDWIQQNHGIDRFVVSGLCGGAITGLLTGSRDQRVVGLLALGITPLLASRAADPSLYMTQGQLDQMRRGYIGKLFSPKAWVRLLTLRSDYRVIWRSMRRPSKSRSDGHPSTSAATSPESDNASPLFPPAFFKMLSSERPIMLIFGGSDRLHWEFDEKFVARHSERLAQLKETYKLHIVEHANHVLSFDEWQREMLEVSAFWLDEHFPDSEAVAGPRGSNPSLQVTN